MKLLLLAALCFGISRFSQAAPGAPLEGTLKRAATVTVARMIAVTRNSVTFHPTEVLRGVLPAEITLSIEDGLVSVLSLRNGGDVLLLSQGDLRNGPPPSEIAPQMRGQMVYRGWLIYPISTNGDQVYVEGVYSFADGEPFTDGPGKLSLTRIKRLVQRFSYNPHIYDNK